MQRIPIIQGEHRVVAQPDVLISTILGSCVAVCLHDAAARVGGMNHFLLSEPRPDLVVSEADLQRYGVHAMELLINEMMKLGAMRSRLRAQIYGGANVIVGLGFIGSSNATFARRFLKTEGIPVTHADVGGKCARKIEFRPYEGKARCVELSDVAAVPTKAVPLAAGGELELF